MKSTSWSRFVVSTVLLILATPLRADVRLPAVFGDHMVVQQGVPIPVWGWADTEKEITVTLGDRTASAKPGASGAWSVQLDAIPAGGPHVLTVRGSNVIEVKDVLVGEVWLCSGQSNMAMTVGRSKDPEKEAAAATYPQIRMFTTARKTSDKPQAEASGSWTVCSPQTVSNFSATAYFFARRLHKELSAPVGLLHSSWGGTPVQAWTPWHAQEAVRDLAPVLDAFKRALESHDTEKARARYEKQLAAWKEAVAKAKSEGKPPSRRRPRPPVDPNLSPHSPGRLYNAMIAPLAPYAIRGAIWYQGESNAGKTVASLYGLQLRTMIDAWRKDWNKPFPFLYVQLPNFRTPQQQPSEGDGWTIVREQMLKSLGHPGTGMAVVIDAGEANDIHPKDKQTVGHRLAQWALARTYRKPIVACGPIFKGMRADASAIICEFDCIGGGLIALGGGPLRGFALAGEDKQFHWAEARIAGTSVIVTSPKVAKPVAVRYAWAVNPACNLGNQEGLPASPFRSDDWEP